MDLSLVPFMESPAAQKASATVTAASETYRECLRNHAATMGGQAYDGCGEYMAGEEESLKCAACGCHRNFHRRGGSPSPLPMRKHAMLLPSPAPVSFFPPPPVPFHQIPLPVSPDPAPVTRGGSETPPRKEEGPMRKRYRTKFTAEQKEKMRIFSEKLGWRIQKHDDEALEEFCVEIGVNRHVLKVWMHNHKNNRSSSAITAATTNTGVSAAPATPTILV